MAVGNVSNVSVKIPQQTQVRSASKDSDGDNDGDGAKAAPVQAPSSPNLAPAGQVGSLVNVKA